MSRPSTIDQLPSKIREQLNAWLRDPGITQTEATRRINVLLTEYGGDRQPVSRHAVNRYDLRMRAVGERLQQSRQVAEVWISRLGAQPQGQLGNLINEMLRSLAFDLSLKLAEGELTEESLPGIIEQLRNLSLSALRLERAATENVQREREIRRQAAEDAAETAGKSLSKRGLSPEVVDQIKSEILGVS